MSRLNNLITSIISYLYLDDVIKVYINNPFTGFGRYIRTCLYILCISYTYSTITTNWLLLIYLFLYFFTNIPTAPPCLVEPILKYRVIICSFKIIIILFWRIYCKIRPFIIHHLYYVNVPTYDFFSRCIMAYIYTYYYYDRFEVIMFSDINS